MIFHPSLRLLFALIALMAAPFLLSACDTVDDEMVEANLASDDLDEAPPLPQSEVIPYISDKRTQIWRPGYWALIDHRFVWIEGRVIRRPSPTAAWHSATWAHHAYGWSLEMGHWE